MGWSWALCFAQEAVSHIVSGYVPRPLQEIRGKQPAPSLDEQRVITGVYVDNISIIGKTADETKHFAHVVEKAFADLNIPLTWSDTEPSSVFETVGIKIDFNTGMASNKPRRLWRVFFAGREILRRKVISVKLLEIWLGHMTSIFMLTPQCLSCFFHIYKFIAKHRGSRATVWKTVRQEVRTSLGLIWMARANLRFNPIHQLDVGDSSGSGFALLKTWATKNELKQLCQWRESWRFRSFPEKLIEAASTGDREQVLRVLNELDPDTEAQCDHAELKAGRPFGAGLKTRYADWIVQAKDPSSWLRTSSVKSQLRPNRSKKVEVDVPALVQPVDSEVCRNERYSLLWRKSWRGSSHHINLRRSARVRALHGKVKVTLCDNLAAICAFDKGRSSSSQLNRVCQIAAGYQLVSNIRWRLRHVETDRNPADHDSRFLEKPKHKGLGKKMRERHVASHVMEADLPAGDSCPTSSTSSSASLSRTKPGMFLEVFSGSGRLTTAVQQAGLASFNGIDNKNGVQYDLRRRSTQLLVISWVKSGLVSYVHLGTPCTVFSRARHGIRDNAGARERERIGLELAFFTAELIITCSRYNVYWSLENPRHSRLFDLPVLVDILHAGDVRRVDIDFCMYHEPYKKPTSIFTNFHALQSLARTCNHRKHAVTLRGSEMVKVDGKMVSQPKTRAAGAYPVQLASMWAQAVRACCCRSSHETKVLSVQFEHELAARYKEGKTGGRTVQSAGTDRHIQWFSKAFGDPFKVVTFGQHSNKQAQERQKHWERYQEAAERDFRKHFEN
eukprot:Skav236698  [mRNA]  locus=scaffold4101:93982:96339:- [translate_table: standard]